VFTLPFAQRLRDFVSNGISFIYLQANYLEWQLQDSLTRQQQFNCHKTLWERLHASNQQSIPDCSSSHWDEYKEKILSFCPSDGLLCDIFLKDFEKQKDLYENAMRSTTASCLMADHTFKVS
jgi:hypothetical protein